MRRPSRHPGLLRSPNACPKIGYNAAPKSHPLSHDRGRIRMTVEEFAGKYHLPLSTYDAERAKRWPDLAPRPAALISYVGDPPIIPGQHGSIVQSLDNPASLMAWFTHPKAGLAFVAGARWTSSAIVWIAKFRLRLAGMKLLSRPSGDRLTDALNIHVEFNPENRRHASTIIRMVGFSGR